MTNCVRLVLSTGDRQNDMTIDLVLNTDGTPKDKLPFGGWWGSLQTDDILPFILLETGQVDFGSDYDSHERFGTMLIHGRKIEVNASVAYQDAKHDFAYRVVQLNKLDESVMSPPSTDSQNSSFAPGRKVTRRGGRPPQMEKWTEVWLALLELSQKHQLNVGVFSSQAALRSKLMDMLGEGSLSDDALKPVVSRVWHEHFELLSS